MKHPVGTIIYFTPFYFLDGKAAPRNKYFIILGYDQAGAFIVASLPSSVDHVPESVMQEHGCTQLPEAMFSVYIFESGRPITTKGWGFPLTTYVYINWINQFEARIFKDIYVVPDIDYQVVGRLTKDEFEALRMCALTSSALKKRFRKALATASY